MVLLFDNSHNLDLVVSRWKFEKALFDEEEGWLRWNEMDVSRSFMTMNIFNYGGVGGCTG